MLLERIAVKRAIAWEIVMFGGFEFLFLAELLLGLLCNLVSKSHNNSLLYFSTIEESKNLRCFHLYKDGTFIFRVIKQSLQPTK